jgi:two-component system, LytTR family, response regulator
MKKIKAAVIDDEYFNRELISLLITRTSDNFEICGCAGSMREGIVLIKEKNPEVIFLDIKMPDGSGFDLLSHFEPVNFEVIFVTGFDNYALKAFEFNALDYILKPVDLDKFKLTLERIESRIRRSETSNQIIDIFEKNEDNESIIIKIPVHHNEKVILLNVTEILYIQAKDGYTEFVSDRKYISSKQLSDLDFILEKFKYFVRINKSTVINIYYVKSYSKGPECIITMTNNETLEVSRRKKSKILELLKVNH